MPNSPGSLDSSIDVSRLTRRNVGDLLSGSRVEGLKGLAVDSIHPFIVDEALGGYRGLATGEEGEFSDHRVDKLSAVWGVGSGEVL